MTKARDVMHAGVQCIPAHETLDRAAQMMRELDVGALPICGDDDRLQGIITDRDIVVKCIAAGHDPSKVTASELAQGTPQWIDADADISEAVRQMTRHRIKRLPVIENKRLVGMISEADLAQKLPEDQLAEFVEKVFTPH
ncbi:MULTISPECIES: CBS domain-containing protein [Thermomonospora]|uniref:Putative signal transduction protein with CBS domains n=1 Tax=Thermomonospora curvata (strain ATCC 19995 / DSM 43183 / JCM 3096 / KCTC 9072 / NBRC 15933 / NCIMB 10081 / Henssen B9) TaxID=471852 RepID=D1ABB7_THECD|nr:MULTISPECIES: CBS domain-containing protein [Thermomonospora]ACY97153.1 putative signal transduction protein with CBS domains [Thermomonospora curvata DSM 43183]PKK15015.1 MAG: CBS domain-containing protein [Thermomonospora sp. CIF 1]